MLQIENGNNWPCSFLMEAKNVTTTDKNQLQKKKNKQMPLPDVSPTVKNSREFG